MGWETFQFGQLYLDGIPQRIPIKPEFAGDIPQYNEGQRIEIAGSSGDKAISWIKPNGMNLFVADRVLLDFVSWDDLDKYGFVAGETVCIGSQHYLCRVLQVGSRKGQSEWDSILDATSIKNDVWHWASQSFWGSDLADGVSGIGAKEFRANRGYSSARNWNYDAASVKRIGLGFRPVLEPLAADPFSPENKILVLDGQHFVLSQLQGAARIGFYPQLSPVETKPFAGIPNGSKVRVYALLCNDAPVCQTGVAVSCLPQSGRTKLTITDKFYGDKYLIPWTISNGVAVVDKPVLAGVDMNNVIMLDS